MAKIIGNTTATPVPRPDWEQSNETKADYIKNKPEKATVINENSTDNQYATAKAVYDYIPNDIRETVYIGMDGYCYKKDGTKYSLSDIFTMPLDAEFSVYAREFLKKYNFVLLYNYGDNAEEALYPLATQVFAEGEIFFSAIVVNGSEIEAHGIIQFTGLYIAGDETISVNAYPIAGEFLTFADGFLNVDKFALLGNIGNMTMREYIDSKLGEGITSTVQEYIDEKLGEISTAFSTSIADNVLVLTSKMDTKHTPSVVDGELTII